MGLVVKHSCCPCTVPGFILQQPPAGQGQSVTPVTEDLTPGLWPLRTPKRTDRHANKTPIPIKMHMLGVAAYIASKGKVGGSLSSLPTLFTEGVPAHQN